MGKKVLRYLPQSYIGIDRDADASRILSAGGRYAIHELGLQPDDLDDELKTDTQRSLAKAIHVNAGPLTMAEWCALLENEGFIVDILGKSVRGAAGDAVGVCSAATTPAP